MIEVIDLPFAEAKEMVTCQASEDKIENYDATFLFLIYWFLYNKESTVIRNRFQEIDEDIRMRHIRLGDPSKKSPGIWATLDFVPCIDFGALVGTYVDRF